MAYQTYDEGWKQVFNPGIKIGNWLNGNGTQQFQDQLQAMGRMPAPQMGPAAQGQDSFFRQQQAQLINQLEAQAQGRGPSLAAQQLQAGQDRAQRQGQAQAAASMGPNAALAQFQAQSMAGQGAAQANQDAAMARMQEQYNAQSMLGQNLAGARGADEAMSQFNAGARNQQMDANLQAKLAAMGINRQALQGAGQLAAQPKNWEAMLSGLTGLAGQWSAQKGLAGMGGGGGMNQYTGGAPTPWFGAPGQVQ